MASALSTRSAFACIGCQRHLISRFAALAGVSQPLYPASRLQLRQGRAYSQTALREETERSTARESAALPGIAALQEGGEGSAQAKATELEPKDEELPWYLRQEYQDEAPRELPKHLADRQRIPDLPDLPPPLLETLLQHISVDLGLDDLSLLDLRSLDPPSALGANLIMVVGTARSEKHLHVSADRFCRYLRSTHKLRAHADGLLGRGELKIRMRRMAKRSRILANVGAKDTKSYQDDIRTGWVCVMIDGMEPHPDWVGPKQSPDFVGFDERSDRVHLVVQMFTEAKREEIDLETLWTRRYDRAENGLTAEESAEQTLDEDMVELPSPIGTEQPLRTATRW